MRYIMLTLLVLAGIANNAYAGQDGYKIQLKFNDKANHKVYLASYYGKPLPTIYRVDSAQLDDKGVATFNSTEKITGGIYLMVLDDNATYFEFLLDNGDDFSITATASKLPKEVKFKNSEENKRFNDYVNYLTQVGEGQQQLQQQLSTAKTQADSNNIYDKAKAINDGLNQYRVDYIKKYPKTLLANISSALLVPEAPKGPHYNEDGSVDSMFAFRYYKEHYWDGFDFSDERLIYTPIYESKLQYFFNNVSMPLADSVIYEGDKLLAKARASKEVFKYTLHWLTSEYTQKSDVMGLDAAFAHFIEKYYMKGDAFWLNPGTLQKYIDRYKSIAPNMIGNLAPPLTMRDVDSNFKSLYGVEAKYTLIVFWSPTCGHCLEEVPRIDSVYKAVLKDKGVKVYAVNVDRDQAVKWKEQLKKLNLDHWTNVYDPDKKSPYKSQYDIYGTPRVYLLDEKKVIIGKNLDHTTIGQVIEMEERK
ncbi:MAG: DUF5106 domain-containing protein [Flavipsychrobacter sp.]